MHVRFLAQCLHEITVIRIQICKGLLVKSITCGIWLLSCQMLCHKIVKFLGARKLVYNLWRPGFRLFHTASWKEGSEQMADTLQKSVHSYCRPPSTDCSTKPDKTVKKLSVEGNIAAGKSTFLRLLCAAQRDWSLVAEPLSKWQCVHSSSHQDVDNLLQLLYDDPARWSYTFQTLSCMSRFKAQIETPPEHVLKQREQVQIFERSVYSDRFVFAKTLFELGHLNGIEWAMYQEWHSFLLEEFGKRAALDGIIYLRAAPEKCFERLQKRGRKEEKTVTQDYLKKLHDQHERWLIEKTTGGNFQHIGDIPVLVLDVGEEFEGVPSVSEHLSGRVKEFVASL
ncbi:deoxyguanosine kinase, mitochondrial-like [Hyla sarda]|uniref:deoxyguanosine kinase, mitochondrial-like n=1 Tax=Hyla sarda TaxID=327740 RepID=UPI0024C34ADC|nr:deoxyguanosine kinase, mitochondrial-like [Hyla sarda]